MLWLERRRLCHTPNYDHSDTIYWHCAKDADVALVPDSSLEFSLVLQVCRHWDGNDGQRCQPTRRDADCGDLSWNPTDTRT